MFQTYIFEFTSVRYLRYCGETEVGSRSSIFETWGHTGLKYEHTVVHVEVVVSLAGISVNVESEMIKIHRIILDLFQKPSQLPR